MSTRIAPPEVMTNRERAEAQQRQRRRQAERAMRAAEAVRVAHRSEPLPRSRRAEAGRRSQATESQRGTRAHVREASTGDKVASQPATKPTRTSASARPARPRTPSPASPQPRPRRRRPTHQHESRPLQRRVRQQRRPKPGIFRAGDPRRRLLAIFVIVVLFFAAVLVRVAMLQTTHAQSYIDAGSAQRTRETRLRADRGVIFDRNGAELALSVPATTIWLNPKLIVDGAQTVASLSALLHLSTEKQQSLLDTIEAKDKSFAYVKRQIDDQTAAVVMALNLPGVDTYRESTRVVPGGDLAQNVIGRTDTDGVGTAGLELQFDKVLTGVDGEMVRQRDQGGRSIPGSEAVTRRAVPGQDLVLTLDRSIQFTLEQALMKQVQELGARGGTAVVMAVDGDILAMACVRMGDDLIYHITAANCAAVDSLEPGSVAKVVTISAGLNEGLVTPETTLSVPGFLLFNQDATNKAWRQRIDDAHIHNEEPMTVHQILVESSNVGTVKISQMLKPELQYNYMTSFGFGKRSDLNFPGESVGILPPWQEWEGTEKVTKSYGYGVSATAVQLVGAVNVIANNGVYVAPRLVKATIGGDGTVVSAAPPATRQVLTPEVAQQTNIIMRDVVCNGTATAAQIDGVSVAGKTGTGIKAINGVYPVLDSQKKYYSSFVGFFPAENPAATVLISIDEPPSGTQNRFGGTAAAPVFKSVVPTIMHQLGIQPGSATGGCPQSD